MRLSLWQSFSSNHSAPFTVVGVFGSPAEAEAAAAHVREFVAAMNRETPVAQWFDEPDRQDTSPTAEDMLDWSAEVRERIPDELESYYPFAVLVIDVMILVDGSESQGGAPPLDYLVRALGATTFVQGTIGARFEPDGHFTELLGAMRVDLTCRAPDSATADAIEAALTRQPAGDVTTQLEPLAARRLRGFAYHGWLRREGLMVRIDECGFKRIQEGLPKLVARLRAYGCTELNYQVKDAPQDVHWVDDED